MAGLSGGAFPAGVVAPHARRLDFLHPFLHAQNRPDLLSTPLSPPTTSVSGGRETQAVQSRFAIGNTHLKRLRKGPLASPIIVGHPVRTSLRTLSDCHRYSVTACSITRLYAPLLAVAAPLAGHSFGVDLGRFPRSLSVQLRRRYAALHAPSHAELGDLSWLGSESHFMRC